MWLERVSWWTQSNRIWDLVWQGSQQNLHESSNVWFEWPDMSSKALPCSWRAMLRSTWKARGSLFLKSTNTILMPTAVYLPKLTLLGVYWINPSLTPKPWIAAFFDIAIGVSALVPFVAAGESKANHAEALKVKALGFRKQFGALTSNLKRTYCTNFRLCGIKHYVGWKLKKGLLLPSLSHAFRTWCVVCCRGVKLTWKILV